MKMPGILPLVFFLFLVPALTPVIERFWPTATTWWSALLVAVLGAAASAGWLLYRKQLAKVEMPGPAATLPPGDEEYTWQAAPRPSPLAAHPTWRSWLLG
jgi:hypothetical protein